MGKDMVDQLYDNLKEDGWVDKDREYFRSYFLAPGEQGYKNRYALYKNMKEDGYVDSPTYEEFVQRMGLRPATQPGNANAATSAQAKPTNKPAAQQAAKPAEGLAHQRSAQSGNKAAGAPGGLSTNDRLRGVGVYAAAIARGANASEAFDAMASAVNGSAQGNGKSSQPAIVTPTNSAGKSSTGNTTRMGVGGLFDQPAPVRSAREPFLSKKTLSVEQIKRLNNHAGYDVPLKDGYYSFRQGKNNFVVSVNEVLNAGGLQKWAEQQPYNDINAYMVRINTDNKFEYIAVPCKYVSTYEKQGYVAIRTTEEKSPDQVLQYKFSNRTNKIIDGLWSEAEKRQKKDVEHAAQGAWDDYAMLGGGREQRVVAVANQSYGTQVARFKNFDLQRMAEDTWSHMQPNDRQALTAGMEEALREQYKNQPEKLKDPAQLRKEAEEQARKSVYMDVYNYAVRKQMPKGKLDLFMRQIIGMNSVASLSTAVARSAAGTGDGLIKAQEAGVAAAAERHPVTSIAGTVVGMATDPVTALSAGAGAGVSRAAMAVGGRIMLPKATAAVAGRAFALTRAGKWTGALAASAGNFATFEGVGEAVNQLKHGGYVNSETGETEDYSVLGVVKKAGHGAGLGLVMGAGGVVIGNAGNHVAKAVERESIRSSALGAVSITSARALEKGASVMFNGTVFAADGYLETGKFDLLHGVATDLGFKVGHGVKSAGQHIVGMGKYAYPRTVQERAYNNLSFAERWVKQLGVKPDMQLTKDELEELRAAGYPELGELFASPKAELQARVRDEQRRRSGERAEGPGETDAGGVAPGAPHDTGGGDGQNVSWAYGNSGKLDRRDGEMRHDTWERAGSGRLSFNVSEFDGYEAFGRLMEDTRVSEATRAKLYWAFSDRGVIPSTVVGYRLEAIDKNGNLCGEDGLTVNEVGSYRIGDAADRVVVCAVNGDGNVVKRSVFKGKNSKAIREEIANINRQAELNTIAIGERFSEYDYEATRLRRAVVEVANMYECAAEDVWTVYTRAKSKPEEASATDRGVASEVDRVLEGVDISEEYMTAAELYQWYVDGEYVDGVRFTEKVDFKKALSKPGYLRSDAESAVVTDYIKDLYESLGEPERYDKSVDAEYRANRLLAGGVSAGEAEAWAGGPVGTAAGVAPGAPHNAADGLGQQSSEQSAARPGGAAGMDELRQRMQAAQQRLADADAALLEACGDEQTYEHYRGLISESFAGFAMMYTTPEEMRDAILEYASARAALQGLTDGAADLREARLNEARAEVEAMISVAPEHIMPIELKTGETVYLKQGIIFHHEDGTIDTGRSDDLLVVYSAERKKYEMVSIDDVAGEKLRLETEEVLRDAEARVAAEFDEQAGVGEVSEVPEGEVAPEVNAEMTADGAAAEPQGQSPDGDRSAASDDATAGATAGGADAAAGVDPSRTSAQHRGAGEEPVQRALERIPVDEKGEPQFEQAPDSETAWDGLVEAVDGAEADAADIAQAQIANIEAAIAKHQKHGPKLSGTPMQMAAQKKDYNNVLNELQGRLDAWKGILGVREARAEEQRAAAEAARLAENERLRVESQQRLEVQRQEEARKKAEQQQIGANAVSPEISQRWQSAPKISGDEGEYILPDGESLSGRYVLVESGYAAASHDPNNNYEQTEGFPADEHGLTVNDRDYRRDKAAQNSVETMAREYDGRAIQTAVVVSRDGVVLSGNNRTMSGDLAAALNTDKAYIDYLRKHAGKYGFSAGQIDGMQHPRLVFELDEDMPYTATTFARFNASETKGQSKPEKAVKAGKTMSGETFDAIAATVGQYDSIGKFYADGEAVAHVIGLLLDGGVILEKDKTQYVSDEYVPYAEGRELIENVLVGKSFEGNDDAVRQMIANSVIRESVVMALVEIARNRTLAKAGYDLTDELSKAIDLVSRAKAAHPDKYKRGVPVSPFGMERGLFDDEYGDSSVTDAVVLLLADLINSSKPSELRANIAAYNKAAEEAAGGQMDIFSGEVPTKEDILNKVTEQFRNANTKQRKETAAAAVEDRKQRADGTSRTGAQHGEQTAVGENAGGGAAAETAGEAVVADAGKEGVTTGALANVRAERRAVIKANCGEEFTLSDESANNGEVFMQDSNGNTNLAHIPNEIFDRIGIAPVPFKLTETMAWHVYNGHKKELKFTSIDDAIKFILNIVNNVDHVRLGRDNSYIFSVENGRKKLGLRAITIVINSETGEFMGIRTSGYEGVNKLKERPLLWERGTLAAPEDVATPTVTTIEAQQGDERTGRTESQSKGEESLDSVRKVSTSSPKKQETGGESSNAVADNTTTEASDANTEMYWNCTITKGEHTGKGGRKSEVYRVEFDNELSPEEKSAVDSYINGPLKEGRARKRGWYDEKQGVYMMRSKEAAEGLDELISKVRNGYTIDEQPLSKEELEQAAADARDEQSGAMRNELTNVDDVAPGAPHDAGVGSGVALFGESDYSLTQSAGKMTGKLRGVEDGVAVYVDENGEPVILIAAASDRSYIGFYRESGANRWTCKAENDAGRETWKAVMSAATAKLPAGAELYEKTSLSADGLRMFGQQLKHGWEATDEMYECSLNAADTGNMFGRAEEANPFKRVSWPHDDIEGLRDILEPYLAALGLSRDAVTIKPGPREKGMVRLHLPVLRKAEPKDAAVADVAPGAPHNVEARPEALAGPADAPEVEVKTNKGKRKLVITDEMKADEDIIRGILGISDEDVSDDVFFRDGGRELTPEEKRKVFAAGVNYALRYIDQGIVDFEAFASAMVGRLTGQIKPWLKAFYNGARDIPGYEGVAFTPYEEVARFDVANFDRPDKAAIRQAEMVLAEQEAKKIVKEGETEVKKERDKKREEEATSEAKTAEDSPTGNSGDDKVIVFLPIASGGKKIGAKAVRSSEEAEACIDGYLNEMADPRFTGSTIKTKKTAANLLKKIGNAKLRQLWGDWLEITNKPSVFELLDAERRARKMSVEVNTREAEILTDRWRLDLDKSNITVGTHTDRSETATGKSTGSAAEPQGQSPDGDRSAASGVYNLGHKASERSLAGDSKAYAERRESVDRFVDEIGAEIMARAGVLYGREPLDQNDIKRIAAKYPELKDMSITDLQELVELSLTKITRDIAMAGVDGNAKQQRQAYDRIVQIYQTQPRLSARDSERLKLQQYSTPTPLGYLGGLFLRSGGKEIKSGFEPSAGNGALIIALPPEVMHVNDIDQARLANLRKLGYGKVTARDALLPFGIEAADAVMTNPPFGTVAVKEYDGIFKISSLEGQMAINALDCMADDGRAFIIIGGNTSYRANGSMNTKDAALFGYLYSHYNVVDVINISGNALYSRNGTDYDVRMILIDGRKRGEFKRAYPPVKAQARAEQVTTFDELYNRIQDDIRTIQQVGDLAAGQGGEPRDAADGKTGTPVRGGSDTENGELGGRPGERGEVVRRPPRVDDRQSVPGHAGAGAGGLDNGHGGNAAGADDVRGGQAGGNNRQAPQRDNSLGDGRRSGGGNRSVEAADRPDTGGTRLDIGGGGKPAGDTVPGGARKPAGDVAPGAPHDVADGLGQRATEQSLSGAAALNAEKLPYPKSSGNGFDLMSVVPANQVEAIKRSLSALGDVDDFIVGQLGYSGKDELYEKLAAEQIDSVALAINQMNQGKAFIIGDMTGVGKGRQGAALIRYAVKSGKVPVYFTQKATLFSDNYRDLCDIGSGELRPFVIASDPKDANITDQDGNLIYKLPNRKEQQRVFDYIAKHGTLPPEYDFVLTTYSQIQNGTKDYEAGEDGWKETDRTLPRKSNGFTATDRNGQERRDALLRLAEGNIVILDESHSVSGDSGCSRYMQSLTAKAHGVTFMSATFAKRPDNMPIYAQRTAISEGDLTASDLIQAVNAGGVTLQELMSKQLVESGQMIRRERSFEGVTINWLELDEDTDRKQRQMFDEVADIFNGIRKFQEEHIKPEIEKISDAMAATGGIAGLTAGTEALGVKNVPFASKMYNLVNQLLFSLKVDAVADRAIKNLQEGRKPIISFTNTMEGFLKEAVGEEEMDEMPNFSVSLLRALDGVMRYTEKDADANSQGKSLQLEELSEEGRQAYESLRAKILNLSADLPISPMDAIRIKLEQAGYTVGEITGRKVQLSKTENGKYRVESRSETDKKAAARDFNAGKLDVLLINKSGSTGISLHASSKFADQRQRVMVFAQFQMDINDEIQMRGRPDRTGQVMRAMYEYIVSSIPAERRLQMMFKAKLKSLDANTTSSQKSKFNEMEIADFLNKYGDQVVTNYMLEHPELCELLDDPLNLLEENKGRGKSKRGGEDEPKDGDAAAKLCRYLPFLPVDEQDVIFNEIAQAYNVKMQALNEAGENDLEITSLPLNAQTKSRSIWHEGTAPGSGNAFADHTYLEEVEADVLKKPMKRAEIEAMTRGMVGDEHVQDGEVDWDRYIRAENDKMAAHFAAKADERLTKMQKEGDERVDKAYRQARQAALRAREKGSNELSDADIEQLAKQAAGERAQIEENNRTKVRLQYADAKKKVSQWLPRFRPGAVYVIPEDVKSETAGMTAEGLALGTFVGFKFNKDYTAGSSTAVFATLDGRRKVEYTLKDPALAVILRSTENAHRYQPKAIRGVTMDNWDSRVPTQSREKRYIVTGNLLQALADMQKNPGVKGQLVKYTDKDGNIRHGILLNARFKTDALSNSVPISSRLEQLRGGHEVVSEDEAVRIGQPREWRFRGDYYEIRVPKSKQRGGKYTMNDRLLELVKGHNFISSGSSMAGLIRVEDAAKVLDLLSKEPFNVRVKEKAQLTAEQEETLYRAMSADKNILMNWIGEDGLLHVLRNQQVAEDGVTFASPMAMYDPDTGRLREVIPGWWNESEEQEIPLSEEQLRAIQTLTEAEPIYKINGKGQREVQPQTYQISNSLRFCKTTGEAKLQYYLMRDGQDMWVDYNPYDHAVLVPLNDQFKAGWKRPNLVTVEAVMPLSEINNPYRAPYSALPTGVHRWNNGRDLVLSRYSKIVRVVPFAEVAQMIDAYWKANPETRKGKGMDYDRFQPQLREELEKLGYTFSDSKNRYLSDEERQAAYESERAIYITDADVDRLNELIAEESRVSAETGIPGQAIAAARKQRYAERAQELGRELGVDVEVAVSDEDMARLAPHERNKKGMYRVSSRKVTVIVPNHASLEDIEATVFHEGMGHDAWRVLFPTQELYDNAMDEIYGISEKKIRTEIDAETEEYVNAEAERLMGDKAFNARYEDIKAKHGDTIGAKKAYAYVEAGKQRQKYRRRATDEYGARLAEKIRKEGFEKMSRDEQTFWGKLKALLQSAFENLLRGMKIGKMPKWSDKQWAYILHKAYKMKKSGGRLSAVEMAEDAMLRKQSGFDGPTETTTLYRSGSELPGVRAAARERYERRVASSWYQIREAMQDSMLGLLEVYKAIEKANGRKTHIEDVADLENAYTWENRYASRNRDEQKKYEQLTVKPLSDAVAKLAPTDEKYDEVLRYVMAKHGLERNTLMRQRDIDRMVEAAEKQDELLRQKKMEEDIDNGVTAEDAKQKWENVGFIDIEAVRQKAVETYGPKDYGGLTGLMGEATGVADIATADAEAAARDLVDNYESANDRALIDDMWAKINAATKASLSKLREGGLLSKQQHDEIAAMYDYYVPLRGWAETTADEVYGYLTRTDSELRGDVLKKAEGRSSVADDPIATIALMGEQAIMKSNRNMMKQAFLNYVQRNPSDLVTVNRIWLAKNDNGEWELQWPKDIKDGDSGAVVEAKLRAFQVEMMKKQQEHPEDYVTGRQTRDIPYKIGEGKLKEHMILVRCGADEYIMTVNGNPRAAQAINGLSNPDSGKGWGAKIFQCGEVINRWQSQLYTSRNPEFMASNFVRDIVYGWTMTPVKEGGKYAAQFFKNSWKVNPIRLAGLISKYNAGELDMNNPIHKHFNDFMKNGGETGYTSMHKLSWHKENIDRMIKESRGGWTPRKALRVLKEKWDMLNGAAENCARFAAYLTSREAGRSIGRSIYDAKEISVNFNKKGAGATFMGAEGQTAIGNAAAFVSGAGRGLYIFWNPTIQAVTGFLRNGRRHPGKFAALLGSIIGLGVLQAVLNSAGDDEDDDTNDYFNQPDYVRRGNLMIKAKDGYVTIPIAHEYRALFGVGELIASVSMGKQEADGVEIAGEIAHMLSEYSPLKMEGASVKHSFIPSSVRPFVEAQINESWTGLPIYKDTPYNQRRPEWTKAYKSANPYIVGLAKGLSNATGGDNYKPGKIDFNPAKAEYLLNSYFGGPFKFFNKCAKTADALVRGEKPEARDIPFVGTFYKYGDERTAARSVNNDFYKYMDEYEGVKELVRGYERETDGGVMEYAQKLARLSRTPEFKRYWIIDGYRKELNAINDELKEATSDEEAKKLEDERTALRREIVGKLKGKVSLTKADTTGIGATQRYYDRLH